MSYRIKVQDIELSQPIPNIEGLAGYHYLRGTVRLHGTPLASIQVPVHGDFCSGKSILNAILAQHNWAIIRCLLDYALMQPIQTVPLSMDEFLNTPSTAFSEAFPLVTVAVCTRDRADNLIMCLDSLMELDYPALDILVVDNAPTTTATRDLVSQYANVRYVCEPRPGLDWARNRAIIEAKGEIIAFTDDDVVVDHNWVRALAQVFAENPEVMCVTGLVLPYELETEAQVLFERYGGFGRGFERKWYRADPLPWQLLGTGQFGTGANMAYRRWVFYQIGLFNPALDVGTVTNGGGDLEMYFRILKEGHTLVYEPNAIVRHRHRHEYHQLQKQLYDNGVGLFSYFVSGARSYPDERRNFLKLALFWIRYWVFRRYIISLFRPTLFPRDLISAEMKGCFTGLWRYSPARDAAQRIETEFGAQSMPSNRPTITLQETSFGRKQKGVGTCTIDLAQTLPDLLDITEYGKVRVMVMLHQSLIGTVDIYNNFQPVRAMRLRQLIIEQLNIGLLKEILQKRLDANEWSELMVRMQHRFATVEAPPLQEELADDVSVSVVVATHDRSDDLRECLECLTKQNTLHPFEIIVVDNNPASGLAPKVVAEFPGVRLISETRNGVSYARNAGIIASTGDIVAVADDDVVIPPNWLDQLIAPFSRSDVMIVTGNVLPRELETPAQNLFERYGGLSRGFERFEVTKDWFEFFRRRPVPTWELGGTANVAFRATLFSNPEIGLLDEALGPGTPTGVGEDTYIFYKVLKTGFTIVYEPAAYLWHKHRREMKTLRRQIYNYSKGHVAYHLTTLIKDGDFRALVQLGYRLPRWRLQQLITWVRGQRDYPLSLILTEIVGNVMGPWTLWQSYRKVQRQGRSQQYTPISQRTTLPGQPQSSYGAD